MPKNVPSLKPRELIRILEKGGCAFLREGRGDHRLYIRYKRLVPRFRYRFGQDKRDDDLGFRVVFSRDSPGKAESRMLKSRRPRPSKIAGEACSRPGSTFGLGQILNGGRILEVKS